MSAARPRIGVDFHSVDGIFQGIRSHVLGLYAEAIVLAPEIDFVFALADPSRLLAERPEFAAANARFVVMPHASGIARLGWQLAALQRRERLDLLHTQFRLPFVPLGPCACTVHDTLFESHPEYFDPGFGRMARWTGRRAVAQSQLLFSVSEFSRREMSRLYGVDAERIAVTPNGVDATRFFPGQAGADAVRALGLAPGGYLCTVGRLEPRKNHLTLVRAYARLAQPRPPLVIVGQRDFSFSAVFDEVRELGLEGEVRFLERVEDGALPALVRHAMLFVYPSFAEGFGMPVVEAMASGVAVVTSDSTSLPEVAGDAALTVDPTDALGLAAAMQRLIDSPMERAVLAQRGLARAARFNWRDSAANLVRSYRAHLFR